MVWGADLELAHRRPLIGCMAVSDRRSQLQLPGLFPTVTIRQHMPMPLESTSSPVRSIATLLCLHTRAAGRQNGAVAAVSQGKGANLPHNVSILNCNKLQRVHARLARSVK